MKAGDKVVILNHEIVDGPEVFGAVWCVEVDQESGERGKPVMVGIGSIVPVGAVVLSAAEAELGADGLSRLIARYESLANEHDRSGRTEQWLWERNNAAKFSALAAKLSGGAS